MLYSKEKIEKAVNSKSYVWFNDDPNKGFDVNVVSIRNSGPGSRVTNVFDDILTLSYKENGVWKYHEWAITTDPGKKAVLEFSNNRGVAILVGGEYRASHIIRKHQNQRQFTCVNSWIINLYIITNGN